MGTIATKNVIQKNCNNFLGLAVYHIQRLTNLLFSQELYKKKKKDD